MSNVEANRAHQIERVARPNDSRAQMVVETQIPVLQAIFEMKVRGAGSERISDLRERQIVCGYQPNCTVLEQASGNRFRADSAIM